MPAPKLHERFKEGDICGPKGVVYVRFSHTQNNKAGKPANSKYVFRCPICNEEFVALGYDVVSGNTTTCGKHRTNVNKLVFKPGDPFNKYGLTYLDRLDDLTFRVRCHCDKEFSIRVCNRNTTKSCGCMKYRTKHGDSDSRLNRIWIGMRRRCRVDQQANKYKEKGITVCAEWEDYQTFYDWAMSSGYQEHLTIDRRDNTEGYCPENCRWATREEQVYNREVTLHVFIDGRHCRAIDAAKELGVAYRTVVDWYNRAVPKRYGDRIKIYSTADLRLLESEPCTSVKSKHTEVPIGL